MSLGPADDAPIIGPPVMKPAMFGPAPIIVIIRIMPIMEFIIALRPP